MLAETDILPGTRKTAKRRTNIDINIDLGCFCPSGTFDFCHKTYNYTYTQKEISFYRGYTSHEHLLGMGYFISLDPNEIKPPLEIINMNGRIYDPVLGQFMQPDNNVATPEDYIGYDRYAYCLNNPFKYTDPSGEFIFTMLAIASGQWYLVPAAIYVDFFTDFGYDTQKFISPIAAKVDFVTGSHQRGIGIKVSAGLPAAMGCGFSARINLGVDYLWRNYDLPAGFQGSYGWEIGVYPWGVGIELGGTYYDSPGSKYDQYVAHAMVGIPGLNVKYENDWMFGIPFVSDNQDRYRTAAVQINFGKFFSIGTNLMTGDPGDNLLDIYGQQIREIKEIDGHDTYIMNRFGNDPDECRAGVFYIGFGGIRIGQDSEQIRNRFQNAMIHNWGGIPYFKVLKEKHARTYFQFGTGGGYLW